MDNKAEISPNRNYKDNHLCIKNVGAFAGSDAFLLLTKEKAVLIDTGFSFCADKMIENIKAALGDRTLDYILLTHSHYDHASGSPYCKAAFKEAKVVASAYAAKIFTKPTAIDVMREMNLNAAKDYGYGEFEDKLAELNVDTVVGEGDMIALGDITLQVMAAPGHTKCSIAFYIPEAKMLISCETMGVYAGEELVAPGYLVGYEISINFIKRALALDINKILVPHLGVLAGKDCKNFLANALRDNALLKDLIITDHQLGKTEAEIIAHYKEVFYNEFAQKIQPLKAFELNASYLVPMLINEFA